MKTIVTNDVLESYIYCRYKSYLKLIGQSGIKSDYERLRLKLRSEVKRNALSKIQTKVTKEQITSNVYLKISVLEKGSLFILKLSVEDDNSSLVLDGIKKVATKQQEHYFYAPILFYEGSRIRKEQRLILELFATFLAKFQAIIPVVGIVWYGKECKQTTE